MRVRLPPSLVLLLVTGACLGIIVVVALMTGRGSSTARLLRHLPSDGALIVYVDFSALRRAGILELFAESRLAEEPEYRAFSEQSGFDFRDDLDSALMSFHRSGNFFLLRGRFDWRALNDFVARNQGTCYNTFCRVAGSQPNRRISYFPLRRDIMALAVSSDEWAASRMLKPAAAVIEPPDAPVWSLIPAGRLKSDKLPTGTQPFARSLAGAESILISAGPKGEGLELLLDVTCRTREEAAALAGQLNGITSRLRASMASEHRQPDPRDLSGVLTAGVFDQQERRVLGRWPIEKAFLESLAGSAL